ncbi:MAG TPA: bifunctional diguanylate cyclase/phosphodiesterase [Candidatus Binatia bacterium]|nr:bifunctional diguanylate cyclase/phosphodiesterase [Candidatus Binatia bacterium]
MSPTLGEIAQNAQFETQIRQALVTAQRKGRQVGLLIIDFAGRVANDQVHGSDDLSEKAFALIGNTLRDSDTLCRITGSGTAVLLSSLGNPDDAILVAKKILDKLDESFHRDNQVLRPQIGVALYPNHGHSASSLLKCADVALSTARKNNERWLLYSPQFSGSPRPPLHLRELRQAIVQDQLFVLYQPKIDLRTDRITGVEALTRWRHPVYGLIMPDEFIPLAERTGLIGPLTLWVVNRSLSQCRHWRSEGINLGMAVNLSMWNLESPELPEQIASLLNTTGVPCTQLEFEITESAIMDDPQRAMRTLKAIRELGVHFAIDDFGTGYSSMAHLKKMPVSSIKIDKSFTQNMESDSDSAVIVRAIIDLGHNLGLKVVAEGVETVAAKKMLLEFGCDEAQGYYFSRPVTAADISRLIREAPSASIEPENANIRPAWAAENSSDLPPALKPVL